MTSPASTSVAVASRDQLAALLRERAQPRVRLLGRGSQAGRVPPPPPDALQVRLAGLDRIERLEPEDLTCSVQPGLPREVLDAELAARGLELPMAGTGSVGGMLALDLVGPLTAGGPSPRTHLLGMEAVLADGTLFKSGARVVKSVAGFDVHKLLLGSRGRLFAATLLHLKLRPRPRARLAFDSGALAPDRAVALFRALRLESVPPQRLELRRDADGSCRVDGIVAGRTGQLRQLLRTHGLREAEAAGLDHLVPGPSQEVIAGSLRPSRVAGLLAAVAVPAAVLVRGSGRFEVVLTPAQADQLLESLPGMDADGTVIQGAADRLLRGTPGDPGAQRLERDLKRALDPDGVLV